MCVIHIHVYTLYVSHVHVSRLSIESMARICESEGRRIKATPSIEEEATNIHRQDGAICSSVAKSQRC